MNWGVILVGSACAAAWALVVLPAIVYLGTGWNTRHDHLLGLLSDSDLEFYFTQFRRSEKLNERTNLRAAFIKFIGFADGKRHYVTPLLLLGLVTAIGLWGTAQSLFEWTGALKARAPFPSLVVSAFVGGYAWVVNDQLRRFRTRDFTPHDLYNCAYRILIAVPLAYSLTAALQDNLGVPFAFMLGSFPTTTLITIARRVASQKLNLGDTDDKVVNELVLLQGVNKSNAERYQEEGITSIPELAWADPIDLTIRTNFDLWFVVDCMSQALLWVYLGPDLPKAYKYSLRGAMEAKYLLGDLSPDAEQNERARATAALKSAAVALGMDPESLCHTLEEVARDPYTLFLCNVWDEQIASVNGG